MGGDQPGKDSTQRHREHRDQKRLFPTRKNISYSSPSSLLPPLLRVESFLPLQKKELPLFLLSVLCVSVLRSSLKIFRIRSQRTLRRGEIFSLPHLGDITKKFNPRLAD
jgi:hypothetical protein